MAFIPQAVTDISGKSVLTVIVNEDQFKHFWSHLKTVDAPGIEIHPRLVKVGDVIDFYITGVNKAAVRSITFKPDLSDIPDFHRVGTYLFDCGSTIAVRVDGRHIVDHKIYKFTA